MVLPLRFIPAGAGNTDIPPDPRPKSAVYPRWRGEHNGTDSTNQNFRGLSPLARGTLIGGSSEENDARFIPAGAGNTFGLTHWPARDAVYPRWRGEHTTLNSRSPWSGGLSPLARGTPSGLISLLRGIRFIPAGAGNTSSSSASSANVTVYPRWRGEHERQLVVNLARRGLSPLARGTHVFQNDLPVTERFIPAGAGNTQPFTSAMAATAVYPRWRGEH